MNYFSGKNILITGSDGYIGSSLVEKLLNTNCKLYLLSRKGRKSDKNIQGISADLTHKGVWKKILPGIDMVFHLAAQTSSVFANNNPLRDLQINLLPVIEFIETCKRYQFSPDFIYSGTVTETGFTKKGRINEKRADKPVTVYDINKLAAEKYLEYYSRELKGRATILRLPNIYGPGQVSRADRGIVNRMVKIALRGEPVTVFGTGKYIRDYLFIDDAVNGFIEAARNIKKTAGKYYVIGTGQGHSILQMVKIIGKETARITKKRIKIKFQNFPADTSLIEYRNFTADSTAFRRDTGWKSAIILQEGIRKTIEFYLNK